MKATGIIRRIDDLGRIVIPREIRRTLGIKEGDPFELFLQGEVVCFKKYRTEFHRELKDTIERIVDNGSIEVEEGKREKLKEALGLLKQTADLFEELGV